MSLYPIIVLPAHAGMVPSNARRRQPGKGAPRARGDGPATTSARLGVAVCSPRTRGWSRERAKFADYGALLPAHAGLLPVVAAPGGLAKGLPAPAGRAPPRHRPGSGSTCAPPARGDGPGNAQSSPITVRCSPRTRGCSPSRPSVARGRPVLPAHAGMVPTRTEIPDDRPECSPRTRGWSLLVAVEAEVAEVLPAHAGMVLRPRAMGAAAGGAPRARGDGPSPPTASHPKATCSPRTRGWSRPGRRTPM